MLKNEITHKRVSIVLVIFIALILIAMVIWMFEKRISQIENGIESPTSLDGITNEL